MVRELADRFTRYAPERFHVEIIDPDRNPARAEAMQKKYGIGAYDRDHLKRNIAQVANAFSLSRIPEVDEIYDDRFLPPREERMPLE